MKNNHTRGGKKGCLLATAGLSALVLSAVSSPALAQDAPAGGAVAPQAGEDASPDESSTVIIVTGTRINRPQIDSANPVVSVSSENIEQSGLTNVTELLTQTPALFNSENNFDAAGSQSRFGGTGVNLLDLRNLGPERTLVLVNGRRHVAGVAGEAAVDINTIPVALIDRIDVLTGGVSSVYGADGVSGVVNFIMKRDFEGIDFRAQNGISGYGDAPSTFVAATIGKNFAGGRGNITASYEYRRDGRVAFADRPNGRYEADLLIRNPADIPDDPGIFDNVFINQIGWADSSRDGAIIIDTSFSPVFRGGGQAYDPGTPLPESGFRATGGDNTPVASYQGDLQARTRHHVVNLTGQYELTPTIRFFAEGKYVNTENFSISQPSFDFFTFVSGDNPLIPANIRGAAAGGDFGGGILFNRDNFDLGTRNEILKRDLYRGVAGFDGDLTDNARFEISYVYGENKSRFISQNYRIEDRYFAALDAVDEGEFLTGIPNGNIVCRVDVDGGAIADDGNGNYGLPPQTFTAGTGQCQPLNVFGENVASQASLAFINADLANEYTLSQHVVNGFISGDFGQLFKLPGGPVGFAFGGEYRKEKSVFIADPLAKQTVVGDPNSGVLADLALLGDETGSFDVIEGFAEINIPIFSDMPFFETLDLNSAIRFSDYSTTGSSTSWSVSGVWAPVRDVRFRGSYSEAVRAPNITELFAPRQGTFAFLTDPCSPLNISSGSEFRAANCQTLIESLGADFATFDFESAIESSASIEGISSGNQELSEESARTWTAGVVVQPRFIPRLALSFDWFDIRLTEVINTATLQETTEFCVDAPTLDNPFCNNVQRAPGTAFVNGYLLQPVNVAFFETAGADMTLTYRYDTAKAGRFDFRGTLGYLDKLLFLPADGGTVNNNRGEIGAPKWNGSADITWTLDNVSLNYGVQYVGKQLRFELDEIAAQPDIAAPDVITIGSRFIHDIRADFRTDDEKFNFFLGVNNFTDEQPVRGLINTPTGWLGRYFYAGIRVTSDNFGF